MDCYDLHTVPPKKGACIQRNSTSLFTRNPEACLIAFLGRFHLSADLAHCSASSHASQRMHSAAEREPLRKHILIQGVRSRC